MNEQIAEFARLLLRANVPLRATVAQVECAVLRAAWDTYEGHQLRIAAALGMHRNTLASKLAHYRIGPWERRNSTQTYEPWKFRQRA